MQAGVFSLVDTLSFHFLGLFLAVLGLALSNTVALCLFCCVLWFIFEIALLFSFQDSFWLLFTCCQFARAKQ